MKGNKGIHSVTFILLVIGGLNWLLMVLGWDIASWSFLSDSILNIVYVLVGLSALYEIFIHKADCRLCNPMGGGMAK